MSEVAIWGHGSLLARITPAGDRLLYFQYSNEAGKRYALPIGTYGPGDDATTMTLSDARQRAMVLASLHKTGIKNIREHLGSEEAARIATRDAKLAQLDAEKATAATELARHAARKSVTELFEHWAKVDLIKRKDGGAEVRRMFEKDVRPIFSSVAVADVKKGLNSPEFSRHLASLRNRVATKAAVDEAAAGNLFRIER